MPVNSICFLYQCEYGGTDSLLKRAEGWLFENGVNVIDESQLVDSKPHVDLFVLPTSRLKDSYKIVKCYKDDSGFLIWSMGHGAFKASIYNTNGKYSFFLGFLISKFAEKCQKALIETRSLVYTDYTGMLYDLNGRITNGVPIDEIIYPIAVPVPAYEEKKVKADDKSCGLRAVWLGRVSTDFKVHPLMCLLEDINSTNADVSLINSFTVIGSGDGLELLKSYIKESHFSFPVFFVESVDYSQLSDFLRKSYDVMFAMGTSALDGARSGLPTIIVKPFSSLSSKPVKRYRWIYKSYGFSLGELPIKNYGLPQNDVQFGRIVQDLTEKGCHFHSVESKLYSESFHEDVVFHKLFFERNVKPISYKGLKVFCLLNLVFRFKFAIKRCFGYLDNSKKKC
ncbi:glycosyltransferase [Halomonas sp. YLGW01]|uniref:glycosyltransferase n=1 Tax=Halomonas sp. YLGW01 TaxID=2773308 RepID=UPI00178719FB|nr:glycosyltransferase [Halomonas sp. YLGW01]